MISKYSIEIQEFIAANVKGTTTEKLVLLTNAKFGTDFTDGKMKAYKANHKLKSGIGTGNQHGKYRVYPPEIQQFIAVNINGRTTTEITTLVNMTFGTEYTTSQLKSYITNHKLKNGLDCKFQHGHTPQNKGIKGVCAPGCEKTWFKKGDVSKTIKPVGSERVDVDGYTWVKIADPSKWKPKHVLIWEAENGPVPEGCAILFGDGNKLNLTLDNLILITRRQLAVINKRGLVRDNIELTKAGIMIADICMKRTQLSKELKKGSRRE